MVQSGDLINALRQEKDKREKRVLVSSMGKGPDDVHR